MRFTRIAGYPAANGNGAGDGKDESGPYLWLRRMVETLLEGSNPEEFLEHTKLELFQDQVFCFTPKGRHHRTCRTVQRRSILPMRCTPTSVTPPSALLSTADMCRSTRA